jgi:hypothetical protein
MLHLPFSVLLSSIVIVTITKKKSDNCKKRTGDAHTLSRNLNVQPPNLDLQLLLMDRTASRVILQEPENYSLTENIKADLCDRCFRPHMT